MHASCGTSVRGSHKCYNFILKRLFFTRFASIPCRAPRETSKNIDTALADAMDKSYALNHIAQSSWLILARS